MEFKNYTSIIRDLIIKATLGIGSAMLIMLMLMNA